MRKRRDKNTNGVILLTVRAVMFCFVSARSSRRTKEAGEKGHPVRKAQAPGCDGAQVQAQQAVGGGGARRAQVRQPARAQLVLGERGLGVQVLRGDHGGPEPRDGAQRRATQLDSQGEHETPRTARADGCRAQAPRATCSRPSFEQGASFCAQHMEEAQHAEVASLPLDTLYFVFCAVCF